MTAEQFSSEHLGKNLEFTRAVHEGFSRGSNRLLGDAVTVAVGNSSAMKSKHRFDASRETQEVTNRDIFFVRFIRPFRDGVPDSIVQIQKTVLLSSDGGDTPESLGPAENRSDLVRSVSVGIRLVKNVTILNDEQRKTSMSHRVLLRRCASGHRDLSVERREQEPAGHYQPQMTNRSHEARTTTDDGGKSKRGRSSGLPDVALASVAWQLCVQAKSGVAGVREFRSPNRQRRATFIPRGEYAFSLLFPIPPTPAPDFAYTHRAAMLQKLKLRRASLNS